MNRMIAGAARVDITPSNSVWMDGMIRNHKSTGIHDPLFARALYISDGDQECAFICLDVCAISTADAVTFRRKIATETAIPASNVILAASHTHSGPATYGFFNPKEPEYVSELGDKVVSAVDQAVEGATAAQVGYGFGRNDIASHYRRFRDEDGRVVMIWERNPALGGLHVLGNPDPEVGALMCRDADQPQKLLALLFNHAGHPNVMSGENYLISADYPGAACRLLEQRYGCAAMFTNGAAGSVDIDNYKWRDWAGVEHIGKSLADAVSTAVESARPSKPKLSVASLRYNLPRRKVSDEQLCWANRIIAQTGGTISPLADGVGDDYKALLMKHIYDERDQDIEIEQVCIAIGDCAFISFPGELFTEVGLRIKSASPAKHTLIVAPANGYIGYVPTKQAVLLGGYEVDMRLVDESAADIIEQNSIKLLETIAEGELRNE